MKAIQMCTNRFDDDTKNSFVELYTKVDAGANAESIMEDQKKADIAEQMNDNDSESDDERILLVTKSINHSVVLGGGCSGHPLYYTYTRGGKIN